MSEEEELKKKAKAEKTRLRGVRFRKKNDANGVAEIRHMLAPKILHAEIKDRLRKIIESLKK